MREIETPSGRRFRTVDTFTDDVSGERRAVLRAGGRVVSSSPSGAGYVVRAAYPVAGAA